MLKKHSWLVALLGLLLVMCWSQPAAAKSYNITNYSVNINVTKSGDAQVTQRIRYDFDGDFNGVYYKQDIAGIKGLVNPQVAIDQDGHEQRLAENTTGAPNTFSTTQTDDAYQLKVYHPISNQAATFIYRYQLNGVVTNYADTATLNWKVIGTGWEVPLNNVHITIQLPQKSVQGLQAWAHGPLNGQVAVDRKNGRVVMKVAEVPAKTFVQSRLLFPTTVTAQNPQRSTKKMKHKIQKQEAKFAQEANQKREMQRRIPIIIAFSALAIAAFNLIYQLIWLTRHPADHYPRPTPVPHSFDIPPYSPAVAQRLLKRDGPDAKAFTATLMALAAKGEIVIEADHKTYRLTKTAKLSAATLKQPIFDLLFNQIGKAGSVTMAQIQAYGRQQNGRLSDAFSSWVTHQRQQTTALGFNNKTNQLVRSHAFTLAIISSIFTVIALICDFYIATGTKNSPLTWPVIVTAGLLLVVSWGVWLVKVSHLPRYVQSGSQAIEKLHGFDRMLRDIGHFDTAKVGDLLLWEQILPYAVAFGSAKKVAAALKANFSDEQLRVGLPIGYPLFIYPQAFAGTDFSSSFTSTFSSSVAANSISSTSGGSGGFSGGGTGGFGGGSGGGAF
ncbi:DUF2207 domain-containing protein [Loigolactobacillus backii]|uniref:Uncharacterized protein n=1 Tax=Loigolactobacillus backii TaxID=375175 RepID=A0A192H2Q9_9LACO|nr:DUF2207 domain-containing protein [Loigolactobacillus backii]ANK62236.1 hypothetical protein AYR53_05280 [Loigolactobacillus backii]ANK70749.1 hypothetical protein AYR56_11705 [Loigolactobacillus backii]MDA5387646.1 DUF2207 domain-containing protein [Loigolactobacillus backii]MDA5390197.1 DUF2207 domain-containing protein [Loigolactobacillus backii]